MKSARVLTSRPKNLLTKTVEVPVGGGCDGIAVHGEGQSVVEETAKTMTVS